MYLGCELFVFRPSVLLKSHVGKRCQTVTIHGVKTTVVLELGNYSEILTKFQIFTDSSLYC